MGDGMHQEDPPRICDDLHAASAHALHRCAHAVDKASLFVLISSDPNTRASSSSPLRRPIASAIRRGLAIHRRHRHMALLASETLLRAMTHMRLT